MEIYDMVAVIMVVVMVVGLVILPAFLTEVRDIKNETVRNGSVSQEIRGELGSINQRISVISDLMLEIARLQVALAELQIEESGASAKRGK